MTQDLWKMCIILEYWLKVRQETMTFIKMFDSYVWIIDLRN